MRPAIAFERNRAEDYGIPTNNANNKNYGVDYFKNSFLKTTDNKNDNSITITPHKTVDDQFDEKYENDLDLLINEELDPEIDESEDDENENNHEFVTQEDIEEDDHKFMAAKGAKNKKPGPFASWS